MGNAVDFRFRSIGDVMGNAVDFRFRSIGDVMGNAVNFNGQWAWTKDTSRTTYKK